MTSIDYNDKTLRLACEKKWDVLQRLFDQYVTYEKVDGFEIPISRLLIKDRSLSETSAILLGLHKKACFSFRVDKNTIIIGDINHSIFSKEYISTKKEYKKFAEQYQKSHPSTQLDYNNKVPAYEDGKIKFLGVTIELDPDSNQNDVAKFLFSKKSTMHKKWSCDQIAEILWEAELGDEKSSRKVYTAARGINLCVATKTQIKRLIITGTKEIYVNPQFLK